jgi:hypothetical protein
MGKYLLLFIAASTIGFFAWQEYNKKQSTAPQPAQVTKGQNKEATEASQAEVDKEIQRQKTFKDKDLHKAFSKILQKEKNDKKKKALTEDQIAHNMIEENADNGNAEMTAKQRKVVIVKLKTEIHNNERTIASLRASGEFEVAEKLEDRLMSKREQLENFQQLELQFSGEELETN